MTRAAKSSIKKRKAHELEAKLPVDAAAPPVAERADGPCWSAFEGDEESGSCETCESAQAALDAIGDEASAPRDALLQAQRTIGIADWIDVETGEPAEGQSPPHLQED